jgi:putative oxidoreductase
MTQTTSNSTVNDSPKLLSLVFASNQDSNLWFQLVWTCLRVIAGVMMIHNGVSKLADVEGFASYVVSQTMGLPFPTFLTYCAAYTEIIGAVLLIIGLLTRPASIALLFTMLMAVYFHLCEDGFVLSSFETASLYASMYLFCLVNGGGLFSIDSLLVKQMIGKSENMQ